MLKHGYSGTRLYEVWKGMKARCYNTNHSGYENYGGRGIQVCKEWKMDFLLFREWALGHGYDEEATYGACTLERINVEGNYEPDNCKIITMTEQMNNKTNSRKFFYKGEWKTLMQLAEESEIDFNTISVRLNHGYSIEEALTKPVKHRKSNIKSPRYTIYGETHTFREWADIMGITRDKLKGKTRHKSLEEVVTTFLKGKN